MMKNENIKTGMEEHAAVEWDAARGKPVKVVTYESTFASTLSVCAECEQSTSPWPRDARGAEYAQVKRGAHVGACDICGLGLPHWLK